MTTDADDTTVVTNSGEGRSSGLDRTYRDNLDFRLATLAQLQRLNPTALELAPPRGGRADPIKGASSPRQRRVRQRGKSVLKTLVKPILRVAKPFVRPVLGRIRRSMLEQWQFEVRAARSDLRSLVEANQAQIQELRQVIAQEQHVIATLRKDMLAASAQEQHVIATLRKDMLETSATRDQLSQIMLHLNEIERLAGMTVRRAAVSLGGGEALVRTEVGYMLCSTADPALIACFLEAGELEHGTRLLIQRFLSSGDCFVDVGANMGMHTVAAARVVGNAGRVVAIEPFEETARLLRKSVAINGLSEVVTFHVTALANYNGRQTLYLGHTNAHHSLYPLPEYTVAMDVPVEVPVTTLDTIMAPDCHVDLIKIDVEGAELDVLAGAQVTLAQNPDVALIVELGPEHLRRSGHQATEWLAAFHRLGFTYQVINEETGALEQWSIERLEQVVESVNLFFARLNSPAWAKASVG